MQRLTVRIEGMSCGHCVVRVEKALSRLEGLSVIRVELGAAEILYDPARTPFARVREAIEDAGYSAHPLERAERVA